MVNYEDIRISKENRRDTQERDTKRRKSVSRMGMPPASAYRGRNPSEDRIIEKHRREKQELQETW